MFTSRLYYITSQLASPSPLSVRLNPRATSPSLDMTRPVSLDGATLTERYLPRAARRLGIDSLFILSPRVHLQGPRTASPRFERDTAASTSRHVSVLRGRSDGFGPSLADGFAASPSVEALIIRGDMSLREVTRRISPLGLAMFVWFSEHVNNASSPFTELSRLKRESGFVCVTPRSESAIGKGLDPCIAGPGCATSGGEDDNDDVGWLALEGCGWLASSSEDSSRSSRAVTACNRARSSSGDTVVGTMRARGSGLGDIDRELYGKQLPSVLLRGVVSSCSSSSRPRGATRLLEEKRGKDGDIVFHNRERVAPRVQPGGRSITRQS